MALALPAQPLYRTELGEQAVGQGSQQAMLVAHVMILAAQQPETWAWLLTQRWVTDRQRLIRG